MSAAHEEWIDRWKGILIFLVVLGHVVGGGYHLADATAQPILKLMYKTIYFFHMPAFFFVAGYTFHDVQGRQYLTRKLYRLVVPYFAFGLASTAVYAFAADMAHAAFSAHATTTRYDGRMAAAVANWGMSLMSLLQGGGWPDGEGFRCNSVLWFLPCMFCTMMAFRTIFRCGGAALVVAAALGVALDLSNAIPKGLPWGISKVAGYLPYVILGYGFARVAWTHHDVRNRRLAFCLFLVGLSVYSACALFVPDPTVMRTSWQGHLALYALGLAGSLMSAFAAKAMNGRCWAVLGGASLGIMLLHKFFVLAAELGMPIVRQLLSWSAMSAVVVSTGLSLAVTALCLVLLIPIRRFMPWTLGERNRRTAS